MSRLIALYPRAWRDRYEAEFRALMAERPPDLGDRLDIVRGALDARLHPQVNSPAPGEPPPSRVVHRGALLAIPGGLLWVVASIGFVRTPVSAQLGYKDTGSLVIVVAAAALLSGLAALAFARSTEDRHPLASIAAIAILAGAALVATPWPMLLVGWFSVMIGSMVFALATVPRLGLTSVFLAVSGLLALAFNTENELALLIVPLGAAWIGFGAVTGLRGSPALLELRDERRPASATAD